MIQNYDDGVYSAKNGDFYFQHDLEQLLQALQEEAEIQEAFYEKMIDNLSYELEEIISGS